MSALEQLWVSSFSAPSQVTLNERLEFLSKRIKKEEYKRMREDVLFDVFSISSCILLIISEKLEDGAFIHE